MSRSRPSIDDIQFNPIGNLIYFYDVIESTEVRDYIIYSLKAVNQNKEQLEEKIKNYKQMAPPEFHSMIDSLNEEFGSYYKITLEFGLVAVYSLFERTLKKWIDKLNLYYNFNKEGVKFSKSGFDLKPIKQILSTNLGMNVGDIQEWDKIRNYQNIRNRIVHHGGVIKESDIIKLNKFFKYQICNPNNGSLQLNNECMNDLFETVNSFLFDIGKNLDGKDFQ